MYTGTVVRSERYESALRRFLDVKIETQKIFVALINMDRFEELPIALRWRLTGRSNNLSRSEFPEELIIAEQEIANRDVIFSAISNDCRCGVLFWGELKEDGSNRCIRFVDDWWLELPIVPHGGDITISASKAIFG